MNKSKLAGLIVTAVFVCALIVFAVASIMAPLPQEETPQTPTGEFDFTVGGASDCLRFLNSSVQTVYVPFTVAAGEQCQLTINATKMPGGANGWTDVYLYRGYWNGGANHTCKAGDIYTILPEIESADFAIKAGQPYTATFGEETQQSYTVFFVLPPGGPANFHVTYKQP
ncbi:MAG: hypothetical protein NWE93_02175 [Candidatus Bathyarchaeota archaeon]|nr:hypothetical protein [Candidatus Bathyarchaeota archaeon]